MVELTRLARETFGALQEPLWLAKGLLAGFEFLVQPQEATGVFEEPTATLPPRRKPAGVEGLNLGARELLLYDLLGQLLAGFAVDPGQRYQDFQRRLSGNLTSTDRLLNRDGKLAHQAQSPRHPAGAFEKSSRQLFLAPAELALKLGEQPPLLKRRGARAVGHLPLQHQRLGRLHLPNQSRDRVAVQAAQSCNALVPVDHHVAPR